MSRNEAYPDLTGLIAGVLMGSMPVPEEAVSLHSQPPPFTACPECGGTIGEGNIFKPETLFMRGMVQRSKRPWYAPWRTRPYCAVICPHCKEIVGYEEPGGAFLATRRGPYR